MKRHVITALLVLVAGIASAAFPTRTFYENLTIGDVSNSGNDFRTWRFTSAEDVSCVVTVNVDFTTFNTAFRLSKDNTTYFQTSPTQMTVAATSIAWSIPYTNIPPAGTYKLELYAYEGASTNSARTLAQWKARSVYSLYSNTNDYPWVTGTNFMSDYVRTDDAAYLAAVTNIVAGSGAGVSRAGRIVTVTAEVTQSELDAVTNTLTQADTAEEAARLAGDTAATNYADSVAAGKIDVLTGTGTNLVLYPLVGVASAVTATGAGDAWYNGVYTNTGNTKNGEIIYAYSDTNYLFAVNIPSFSWCLDPDTNIIKRMDADYWHVSGIEGLYSVEDGSSPAPTITATGIGPALTAQGNIHVGGDVDIDEDLTVSGMTLSDDLNGVPTWSVKESTSNAVYAIYVNDKGRLAIAKPVNFLGAQMFRSLAIGANQDTLALQDSVDVRNFAGAITNFIDFSTGGSGADAWIEDNVQIGGIQGGAGGGGLVVGTNNGATVYITNGMVNASGGAAFGGDVDITGVYKTNGVALAFGGGGGAGITNTAGTAITHAITDGTAESSSITEVYTADAVETAIALRGGGSGVTATNWYLPLNLIGPRSAVTNDAIGLVNATALDTTGADWDVLHDAFVTVDEATQQTYGFAYVDVPNNLCTTGTLQMSFHHTQQTNDPLVVRIGALYPAGGASSGLVFTGTVSSVGSTLLMNVPLAGSPLDTTEALGGIWSVRVTAEFSTTNAIVPAYRGIAKWIRILDQ